MSFFCPLCQHPTASHSEICGCLNCRCRLVRRGDFCVNPKGKYIEPVTVEPIAKEEPTHETQQALLLEIS